MLWSALQQQLTFWHSFSIIPTDFLHFQVVKCSLLPPSVSSLVWPVVCWRAVPSPSTTLFPSLRPSLATAFTIHWKHVGHSELQLWQQTNTRNMHDCCFYWIFVDVWVEARVCYISVSVSFAGKIYFPSPGLAVPCQPQLWILFLPGSDRECCYPTDKPAASSAGTTLLFPM